MRRNGVDELYLVARRVLLDALAALGPHRDSLILVGAQAIYLRVGEADVAVAPYTTDGDLAIDPSLLAEIPPLETALMEAGFLPKAPDSVGIWVTHRSTTANPRTEVAVDLLVPASANRSGGRRAAQLPGHHRRVARLVNGLDGALVDADVMPIGALEPDDARSFDLRVAGPAALLVAKLHKIDDRQRSTRLQDKDALDVLRLLRGVATDELAARYAALLSEPSAAAPARRGIELLAALFGASTGAGIEMAVRSVGPLADPAEIAASSVMLAGDLLAALAAA